MREKKKAIFLLRSGDGCASMKTSHLRVDTCLLCLLVVWASIEKEREGLRKKKNEFYIFVHIKKQQNFLSNV